MFKTSNLKHFMRLSAITVSMVAAPAFSSVVMISDDASLQQNYNERYFSQSGISGDEIVVLDTAGDGMPLSFALNSIIPDSWDVQVDGEADATLVSWGGGVAWPHILRNIAHDKEVYISLDWIQKIASVTVPKGSADAYVNNEQIQSAQEEINEFRIKQAEKVAQRNDAERMIARQNRQIEDLIKRQREAQEANQEYIARLNETNRLAQKEREKLAQALEDERSARAAVEDRYAVIAPPGGKIDVPDGAELFLDYQERSVLPFDRSFEYFLRGGHSDIITQETPATYIAKPGTVRQVVQSWADDIGWALEYTAGVEHNNPYEVEFKGSFYEVGREFISIFQGSNRPLNITFHPDVRVGDRHGLVKVMDLNYHNR